MHPISQVLTTDEKLACITLDFETDYGDRVGAFNILRENKRELNELATLFTDLETPVSSFIRTDLLDDYPASLDLVKQLSQDFHCHSHTHNTRDFDSRSEIADSVAAFEKHFGHKPLGYRAPQGILHPGDIELIKENGLKFSASIFPSYRPGKYNHLTMPLDPFVYDNGIVELPFSAIPRLRYTVSLSYLKLLGMRLNRLLFSLLGLPKVLVFDSHLHDFIVNENSFRRLPSKLAMAWGINKHRGMEYFKCFVTLLKAKGYRFITMTELYERFREQAA